MLLLRRVTAQAGGRQEEEEAPERVSSALAANVLYKVPMTSRTLPTYHTHSRGRFRILSSCLAQWIGFLRQWTSVGVDLRPPPAAPRTHGQTRTALMIMPIL